MPQNSGTQHHRRLKIPSIPGVRGILSAAILALCLAMLGLVACQQLPSQSGWSMTDQQPTDDTSSKPPSDTLADTRLDLHSDASPDVGANTWRGWYRANAPDGPSFFVARSGLLKETPEDSESHGCLVSITPDAPRWSISPTPSHDSLRRYRRPDIAPDVAGPSFSEKRLGFLELDGRLTPDTTELPGGIVSNVVNASVQTDPCDTLDALGRCGVPEHGDVCYTGVTDRFEKAPRISVYEAGMAGPRGPVNFLFRARLHGNVADAGTSIVVDATLPALGPADGPIDDWTVDSAISLYLERICASFAGGVTVRYHQQDIRGWIHTVPAQERNSDKHLAMFNLRATDGQYQPAPPHRPDAGPPHVRCPRGPLEFWTTIEYE